MTYEQAVAWLDTNARLSLSRIEAPLREVIEVLEREHEEAERYRWCFDHDDGKTSRVNRVYRMWDGESDWNAAVDAARGKK